VAAGKGYLRSWEDAQAQISKIVAEINANPQLAIAAAVNPLFALEELGYHVAPEAIALFEDRLRFGQKTAARLQSLRKTIFKQAGREFDIDSEETLRHVLGVELKLRVPHKLRKLPPQVGWGTKVPDPLEELSGKHPLIEPLLEYRQLEASEPRLASRDLYNQVRQGKVQTPVVSLRIALRSKKH